MRETERIITQWLSGVPDGSPAPAPSGSNAPTGRTVVVETDEWIPSLVSAGIVDADTALVHRGHGAATGAAEHSFGAGWVQTYTGSFSDPAGDLLFADGFRLRQTRYGLADFSCMDAPTALVLVDEHDFSAFLRDADLAWSSGVFANHVTHPMAVVANVDALGATTGRSGPAQRLFVDSNGAVSTSPLGSALGQAGDDLTKIAAGWDTAHVSEPPDAVSQQKVLPGRDRTDAIDERPWLPRYFEVIRAIRSIRTEHLAPGRVSGFGGRLALSSTGGPDDRGQPILIELGDSVRAVDPATGSWTSLTDAQVALAERRLDHASAGLDP